MDIDKLHFVSKCVLINERNEFLILKRTFYKSDGGEQQWDLPGGSVDLDEDVNLAILREISEEINVKLNNTQIFDVYSEKGIPSGQFILTLFSSKINTTNINIKLSDEHSEYRWISRNEIENYSYYVVLRKRLEYIKIHLRNNQN
jgi:8-oxo-dGTP diphosphatase